MEGYVNVADFAQYLESRGLVIVPRANLLAEDALEQQRLERLQRQLLNKSAISFREALDAKLLPVTTKQGIESMKASGKFREGEIFENKSRRRMILTSAIKRLRNEG